MKVFLALPMYGDVSPLFMHSVLQLAQSPPCQMEVGRCIGNACISAARNYLTGQFLTSDCTHLLFMDSDVLPTPEHISKLISRNVDIVSAMIPKKIDGKIQWAMSGYGDARDGQMDAGAGELLNVKYIGTGLILISRDVFTEMQRHFGFEMLYSGGSDSDGRLMPEEHQEYDFWSQGIYPRLIEGKRAWLMEDFYFCQRARDCGFQIWADTKVIVPHIGTAIYPMPHQMEALQASGIASIAPLPMR
jgi:hypothetical protein